MPIEPLLQASLCLNHAQLSPPTHSSTGRRTPCTLYLTCPTRLYGCQAAGCAVEEGASDVRRVRSRPRAQALFDLSHLSFRGATKTLITDVCHDHWRSCGGYCQSGNPRAGNHRCLTPATLSGRAGDSRRPGFRSPTATLPPPPLPFLARPTSTQGVICALASLISCVRIGRRLPASRMQRVATHNRCRCAERALATCLQMAVGSSRTTGSVWQP